MILTWILYKTWTLFCRYFAKDPFVDLTKVSALRGVYIANVQTNTSVLTIEGQKSLITFDKGGTWVPLTPPLEDAQGHPSNCSKVNVYNTLLYIDYISKGLSFKNIHFHSCLFEICSRKDNCFSVFLLRMGLLRDMRLYQNLIIF